MQLKKKIFVSYRITGEDREELKTIMQRICQSIETAEFDCFYSCAK